MRALPAYILAHMNDNSYRRAQLFEIATRQLAAIIPGATGSGYTVATVAITGGGGAGAVATAHIVSGAVTSYTITNYGKGYTSNPTVTVTGNGTGATATVTLLFFRWTSYPVDLTYSGNVYAHRGMAVGDTVLDSNSGEQTLQVNMDDNDGTLGAIALSYDGNQWHASVYDAWTDASDVVQATVSKIKDGRFNGILRDPDTDPITATLTITAAQGSDQVMGPRAEFGPNCPFTPGDALCTSVAARTNGCARTNAACVSFGNQSRFGGIIYAQSVGTVVLWGDGEMTLAPRVFPSGGY